MKYLYQFGIILGITFLGELLYKLIPLPIPSSIYGLLIMLLCLKFKLIKVEKVKEVSIFLIEIMPVIFIPAGVGLITMWNELKYIWAPIIVITVITTVIVMTVTGKTVEIIVKKNAGKNIDKNVHMMEQKNGKTVELKNERISK